MTSSKSYSSLGSKAFDKVGLLIPIFSPTFLKDSFAKSDSELEVCTVSPRNTFFCVISSILLKAFFSVNTSSDLTPKFEEARKLTKHQAHRTPSQTNRLAPKGSFPLFGRTKPL